MARSRQPTKTHATRYASQGGVASTTKKHDAAAKSAALLIEPRTKWLRTVTVLTQLSGYDNYSKLYGEMSFITKGTLGLKQSQERSTRG